MINKDRILKQRKESINRIKTIKEEELKIIPLNNNNIDNNIKITTSSIFKDNIIIGLSDGNIKIINNNKYKINYKYKEENTKYNKSISSFSIFYNNKVNKVNIDNNNISNNNNNINNNNIDNINKVNIDNNNKVINNINNTYTTYINNNNNNNNINNTYTNNNNNKSIKKIYIHNNIIILIYNICIIFLRIEEYNIEYITTIKIRVVGYNIHRSRDRLIITNNSINIIDINNYRIDSISYDGSTDNRIYNIKYNTYFSSVDIRDNILLLGSELIDLRSRRVVHRIRDNCILCSERGSMSLYNINSISAFNTEHNISMCYNTLVSYDLRKSMVLGRVLTNCYKNNIILTYNINTIISNGNNIIFSTPMLSKIYNRIYINDINNILLSNKYFIISDSYNIYYSDSS